MNQTKTTELATLVSSGLNCPNLQKLSEICGQRVNELPILYWPLLRIFQELADEYDDQGITSARYEAVNSALQSPLLELFNLDLSTPSDLTSGLNRVLSAYIHL